MYLQSIVFGCLSCFFFICVFKINERIQKIICKTQNAHFVLPGPDNMEHLKRIAEEMQKQVAAAGGATQVKDDDEVPNLVPGETFEEVTQEAKA
jgi:phosphoribosylformimino-5-aminoimidazole carboxamide ribonucleotide (ProFAR) isomerase